MTTTTTTMNDTLKTLLPAAQKEAATFQKEALAAEAKVADLKARLAEVEGRAQAARAQADQAQKRVEGIEHALGMSTLKTTEDTGRHPSAVVAPVIDVKTAGPVTKTKAAKTPAAKEAPKAAPKADKAVSAAPVKAAPKGRTEESEKRRLQASAEGRRAVAMGLRPTAAVGIAYVMKDQTMNADAVLQLLKAEGWAPGASKPIDYVSHTLSSTSAMFERVSGQRGMYRVTAEGRARAEADVKALREKQIQAVPAPAPAKKSEGKAKASDPVVTTTVIAPKTSKNKANGHADDVTSTSAIAFLGQPASA
jgi:hypothetical protein